jgi:hypothetical protein
MGYEIKMYVGTVCNTRLKVKTNEEGRYLYDDKGQLVHTDITESWFNDYASIDLCKIYESNTEKLISKYKNKDVKREYYRYEANKTITTDAYGEKWSPIPLKEVIKTLKKM